MPDLVLMRHADHDPGLICRPALGYGLCEVLEPESDDEGDAFMSKPRKYYRPAIGRAKATVQQAMATCPECQKRAYTSKKSAKNAARLLYPGDKMRVYRCDGTPWWHITSQDAARTEEYRKRSAGGAS